MAAREQLAFDLAPEDDVSVWPISAIATILRDRGPVYEAGSGKLAVNQKCVRWNGIDLVHAKEVSGAWLESLPPHGLLQEGDVVVNSTGEGTIGRACVVTHEAEGLSFDSHVLVARARRDRVLPQYLAYFLRSPDGQAAIEESKSAKTTKQTELGATKLGATVMPVPPLVEQRRIVARIEELAARIERARGLRREAIAETTTAVERAKADAIDTLEWDKLPLGTLLREKSQNGLSQRPSDNPSGMPILRISAVTSRQDAIVDEADYKYLAINEQDASNYRVEPGDLLACRFNGNLHFVGRFSIYLGYLDEPRVYPDKLIRFRVDTGRAQSEYARFAMNSPKHRAAIEAFCATTAGNIGVSAGNLKAVAIPMPPLTEQQRIVTYLNKVQAKADTIERLQTESATELDTLLPVTLTKAFRDEL